MKTSALSLIAFFAALLLLVGTQGCYTQFSSTREDRVYVDENNGEVAPDEAADEAAEDNAEAEEGEDQEKDQQSDYGTDWTGQMRMGFDYYYPSAYWPSVGFSIAYGSPYYGWYDPWYSWGYPYYGYGNPYYGYGYPYYGYGYPYDPWYGYPGYWYPVDPVPWQDRKFGSTRGSGGSGAPRGVNASDGMRGGIGEPQQMDLPVGSQRAVTGGTSGEKRGTSAAEKSSRSSGSSRKGVSRTMEKKLNSAKKSTRTDRDMQRLFRDRGSVSGSGGKRGHDPAPSVQPQGPGSGGASSRDGTSRSSGRNQSTRSTGSTGRSYTPPPAAPAPRSSPPPSSGGTSRGSGGGRSPKP